MKVIYTVYVVYNTDTPDPTFEIQEAYTDSERAAKALAHLMTQEDETSTLINEMDTFFNTHNWVELDNGFSTAYGIVDTVLYED